MDGRDLKALRERLGLAQPEMAKAMSLSERSYQSIESGSKPTKRRHRDAAWAAALIVADERNAPSLVPEDLFLMMQRLVHTADRLTAKKKRYAAAARRSEDCEKTAVSDPRRYRGPRYSDNRS